MTSGDTEFTDVTGNDAGVVPFVRGGIRAYYLTGSGGIAETPAQIAAARAAGMGVVLIDQTPGGQSFGAGLADVYDVESLAGTPFSAASACHVRVGLGIRQHTLYVSQSALPALRAAVAGIPGVVYGVANYSWSLSQAQSMLMENPDWVYCQFGDPGSNPGTLIPGTNVTLSQANADIDVARSSWAAQFLPAPPSPPKETTVIVIPGVPGQWLVVWQYIPKQIAIGLGLSGTPFVTKFVSGDWTAPVPV